MCMVFVIDNEVNTLQVSSDSSSNNLAIVVVNFSKFFSQRAKVTQTISKPFWFTRIFL